VIELVIEYMFNIGNRVITPCRNNEEEEGSVVLSAWTKNFSSNTSVLRWISKGGFR
jgi:hypothetical protein